VKPGDLVRNKMIPDALFEVVRGEYAARFMEAQDHEMEAHGMGEYAGVYASAVDVIALTGPDLGRVFKKRKMTMYTKVSKVVKTGVNEHIK